MQPNMPPPNTPTTPPSLVAEGTDPRENPVSLSLEDQTKLPQMELEEFNKVKKKSKKPKNPLQNVFQQQPERIAQDRTSELTIRMLANLAIQLAIKTRNPNAQNTSIRQAEQGYISQLWNRYTKTALQV